MQDLRFSRGSRSPGLCSFEVTTLKTSTCCYLFGYFAMLCQLLKLYNIHYYEWSGLILGLLYQLLRACSIINYEWLIWDCCKRSCHSLIQITVSVFIWSDCKKYKTWVRKLVRRLEPHKPNCYRKEATIFNRQTNQQSDQGTANDINSFHSLMICKRKNKIFPELN
jgi:hypothetical protein